MKHDTECYNTITKHTLASKWRTTDVTSIVSLTELDGREEVFKGECYPAVKLRNIHLQYSQTQDIELLKHLFIMHIGQIVFTSVLLGMVAAAPVEKTKRDSNAHVQSPAAVYTINNQDGIGSGSRSYKYYSGSGTPAAGWPAQNQWVSFENM